MMLRPNSGKMDLEREKRSRKGWSVEGRSDSSLAGICLETNTGESNAPFFLSASEYGSTSREDACFLRAVRSSVRISSQGKILLTREWTTCEL